MRILQQSCHGWNYFLFVNVSGYRCCGWLQRHWKMLVHVQCFILLLLYLTSMCHGRAWYESHVPKTMLHNSCIWKMFFVYIWWNQTEHKIESGSGPLDIRLAQVPKMLSVLRSNWAPKAFCISFKVNLSLYSLFFLVLILRNPMMYMQILDSAWDRLKDSDGEGYKGSKKIQSARSCSQWAINP